MSATSGELRILNFHGDQIVTFEHDRRPVVAMRQISDNMGLNWAGQHAKLLEQRQKFTCMDIHTTGADGKRYKMLCMPVDKLPLWLASINPTKIKNDDIRAKVERYQAESAIALHDYWTKGFAARGDMEGLVTGIDPAVMKALGGMVRSVVQKQIADALPAIIEDIKSRRVAPTFDYAATITSSDVIALAGIEPGQRVRGTASAVTHRLLDFCNGIGCVRTDAGLNPARPWRFPAERAREWLFGPALGAEQIRNQIAARHRAKSQTGQSVLRLVPPQA